MPQRKLMEFINDGRSPALVCDGRKWITDFGAYFPVNGKWLDSRRTDKNSFQEHVGEDRLGRYQAYETDYHIEPTPIIRFTIKVYHDLSAVVTEAETLTDLHGLHSKDSFSDSTFNAPTFHIADDLNFLLYTFGLDRAGDDYPGGYWPEAIYGRSSKEIPLNKPFVPLILFHGTEKGDIRTADRPRVLIVAPFNFYITSPLRRFADGSIGRGLHGSVDKLLRGTVTKTIFFFGDGLAATICAFGDLLLAFSGKERPVTNDHILLERLGHWNAYGGYYAEIFHGLDEEKLHELAAYFRMEKIPVSYFGLDLWYNFDHIGLARSYSPQRRKYPRGLKSVSDETKLPYVLHLSALDKEHQYGSDGDFSQIYRRIAAQLTEEGGITAWHDWLRTQQHLTAKLRCDPQAAEEWFSEIAQAFSSESLSMLLCMETMGMNLASTQQPNIIAVRSFTDYLFGQAGQLADLADRNLDGFSRESTAKREFIKQNLLVGMFCWGLGLYPFYDLFITNRHHPEGFAEPQAAEEALLRALSTGPVGIGDKIGEVDKEIVNRLVFPDGILAKADHPPFVVPSTIFGDLLVTYTESRSANLSTIYLLICNVGEKDQEYIVDIDMICDDDRLIYDYFAETMVDRVCGSLPPAGIAYYILPPRVGGVALLGFIDKYVTLPAARIRDIRELLTGGMTATFHVPPLHRYAIAACGGRDLQITAERAIIREVMTKEGYQRIVVEPTQEDFTLVITEGCR
ncbi:hypothetical protein LM599_02835 [Candidatus Acetothermia bacterium]|nr:hypothetical protein [Candidatus Acetothermia bacterium]MCI2427519.1 hypothetical protein [Candidatus Acetothermia bacterium]MCI2427989.1 hypothetical protein [Candidatus Acetothermia bacterium]